MLEFMLDVISNKTHVYFKKTVHYILFKIYCPLEPTTIFHFLDNT